MTTRAPVAGAAVLSVVGGVTICPDSPPTCLGVSPVDGCLIEMVYEAAAKCNGNPASGVPAPPNNDPMKYGYAIITEPPPEAQVRL